METYRPIQTIPQGLLGFLQLKNAGKNPSELNSLLQSTMDLRDWLWQTAPTEAVAGTAAAIGASGFTSYITIPQQEWWVVYEVTATINQTLATDWGWFAPAYRMATTPGPQNHPWLLAPLTLVDRGGTRDVGPLVNLPMQIANGMPRIFGPGFEIGIWSSTFAGGPDALTNALARITRLRA